MRIEIYLDDVKEPYQVITPPERFSIDTEVMEDGEHKLTLKAIDDGQVSSVRVIPFTVSNGPSIAVHGIVDQDILSGSVSVLANAYGSRVGDEFEPVRMETPAPIPTWAWVLVLVVMAWSVGYITLEVHAEALRTGSIAAVVHQDSTIQNANTATDKGTSTIESIASTPESGVLLPSNDTAYKWEKLGSQVYGINCSSCHQGNGAGLPGVFPGLVNNSVVLSEDPTEHIETILNGLSGKEIDGVNYASPMPAFGSTLSDEEISAVVNHERTQWGNNAPTVTPDDVTELRTK